MIYKKRHREKFSKMAKNNINNNSILYKEDISISNFSEKKKEDVKEIPGYYYDYEKKKYFPTKNSHMKVYSDYLSDKHQNILLNEKKKISEKKCDQLSKLNQTIKEINIIEKSEEFSFFKILKDSKKMNTEGIILNRNYQNIIKNHITKNLLAEELKNKNNFEKYEFINFHGLDFLAILDNSNQESQLLFHKIEIKKTQSEKIIVNTSHSKVITLKYKEQKFTTFKFSPPNFLTTNEFLILINNFEIFYITLQDIIIETTPKVFYINLTRNVKFKNIPLSFEWPIVAKTNSENEYVLLFYKSKILV